MRPESQINLYGYSETLQSFLHLYDKGKLPSKIILTGSRGIGKCTLAYHLINYIFSKNEHGAYKTNINEIDPNSKSFQLIQNNLHPNFYKINLNNEKSSIDVNQIREMIKFSQKTSLNNKDKVILIDQVEYLNSNSANSLLKTLEELDNKIFFILIYNKEKKIIKTIKSRCIEFKLYLDREFISTIVDNYFNDSVFGSINNDFKNTYLSPKTLIDFIEVSEEFKFDIKNGTIEEFIKTLIKNKIYQRKHLSHVDFKLFIELYFRKKININFNPSILYYFSYFNKKYYEFKRYNLDLESFFIEFESKIFHE